MPRTPAVSARLPQLDALRGVAIVLMALDHGLLFAHVPTVFRLGPTRAAMPLFFILAGSLVRRLHWRHALAFVIGVNLPLVATWVDRPNVLTLYAVGSLAVVTVRRFFGTPGLWVGLAVCLTYAANGFDSTRGTYAAHAVYGLMFLGAILGRFDVAHMARRLPCPPWLVFLGRHPLSIYVGHVLVLTAVFR